MRRVLLVVALCSAVSLAGCSLSGSSGAPTATTVGATDGGQSTGADRSSPAASPGGTTDDGSAGSDATDGATADAPGSPSAWFDLRGISADGVNETRLLGTHLSTVNRTTARMRIEEVGSDGTVSGSVLYMNRTAAFSHELGQEEMVTWQSGNATAQRRQGLDGPVYEYHFDTTGSAMGMGAGTASLFGLTIYLTSGDYEVEGVVRHNGTRLLRLRATEAGSGGFGSAYGVYQGEALVDRDGLVRSLQGRFAVSESETPTRFNVTARPAPGGVPRPDWLGTLPQVEGELVADGRAIALRVAGGRSIPAGTSLSVDAGDRRDSVTVDEAIERGETRYLVVSAEDGSADIRQSRPAPDGLVDLRGQYNEVSFTVPGPADGEEPAQVRLSVGASIFSNIGEDT